MDLSESFIKRSLFSSAICRGLGTFWFEAPLATSCARFSVTQFCVSELKKQNSNSKIKELALELLIHSRPFRVSVLSALSVLVQLGAPHVLLGSDMVSGPVSPVEMQGG